MKTPEQIFVLTRDRLQEKCNELQITIDEMSKIIDSGEAVPQADCYEKITLLFNVSHVL